MECARWYQRDVGEPSVRAATPVTIGPAANIRCRNAPSSSTRAPSQRAASAASEPGDTKSLIAYAASGRYNATDPTDQYRLKCRQATARVASGFHVAWVERGRDDEQEGEERHRRTDD